MEKLTNHLSLYFLVPSQFAAQLINLENASNVKKFILLGLSEDPGVQKISFVLFLFFYMIIVAGNLLIIITVTSSHPLSSPMYFFLCYLSFVDICYSSVTAPRMLADFLVGNKTISFVGYCMAQLFFLHFAGASEMFLLTVMAYDRYTAICKPLHYTAIMNRRVCWLLVFACWAGGFLHSIVQTLLTIQLPFCGPNTVDNYFCDVPLVIRLACTDIYVIEWLMASNSGLISLFCFLVLVISYTFVLATIRVRFTEGHWKALSTCASHVMVVTIFFVPCIFIYLRPFSTFPSDKHICVIYTVLSPVLNPLIYTLRNNEMKASMRKLWNRCRDKLGL
uniref:Olfactory receptor n=1 Tax=Melopsittacus undulatus TaxID=13146 RepID=A0A8C6NFC1_MELUD